MISIQGKQHPIYESWNDLPRSLCFQLYALLLTPTAQGIIRSRDIDLLRIEATKILLGIDDTFLERWKAERVGELGEDGETVFLQELKTLADKATNFLLLYRAEDETGMLTNPTIAPITKNHFPKLVYQRKGKNMRLYGPADGLLPSLSAGEMSDVFSLYEEYILEKKPETAIRLIATLWRPGKPKTKENIAKAFQGDRRQPYVGYEASVDHRIAIIQQLPPLVLSLMLHWFDSCYDEIAATYNNLFKSPDSKASDAPNHGWAGILLSLSDGLKYLETVAYQPATNVLGYLSVLDDQRTAEERKRALSPA